MYDEAIQVLDVAVVIARQNARYEEVYGQPEEAELYRRKLVTLVAAMGVLQEAERRSGSGQKVSGGSNKGENHDSAGNAGGVCVGSGSSGLGGGGNDGEVKA
jgi:hypothetical protein